MFPSYPFAGLSGGPVHEYVCMYVCMCVYVCACVRACVQNPLKITAYWLLISFLESFSMSRTVFLSCSRSSCIKYIRSLKYSISSKLDIFNMFVVFAEAYMTNVETRALAELNPRPFTFCRYIDDIFVDVQNDEQLQKLKQELEKEPILGFTTERSVDNKLPFLDVAVDAPAGHYETDVYRKPTNSVNCLSGKSECPDRYKRSVVRAYVHRAFKHCSTWAALHQELQRVRQLLADYDHSASMLTTKSS